MKGDWGIWIMEHGTKMSYGRCSNFCRCCLCLREKIISDIYIKIFGCINERGRIYEPRRSGQTITVDARIR